jgi:hypothetical protein
LTGGGDGWWVFGGSGFCRVLQGSRLEGDGGFSGVWGDTLSVVGLAPFERRGNVGLGVWGFIECCRLVTLGAEMRVGFGGWGVSWSVAGLFIVWVGAFERCDATPRPPDPAFARTPRPPLTGTPLAPCSGSSRSPQSACTPLGGWVWCARGLGSLGLTEKAS